MADGRNLEMNRYALLSQKFGDRIVIYAGKDVSIKYMVQKRGNLKEIVEFLETLSEGVKEDAV